MPDDAQTNRNAEASTPSPTAPRRPIGRADSARPSWRTRWIGAVVAAPCWMVLAVSLWLHPDSRGYDTHTQLGLSPCSFPQRTGLPCPTCGMTTAFAHMARGRIVEGFKTQAFGAGLFVAVLVAAVAGVGQAATGWNLLGRVHPTRRWVLVLVGAFFAAWAIKIAIGLPEA